jgi:L-asparaginase
LLHRLSVDPSITVRTEEFSRLLSYSLGYQHVARLVKRLSELEGEPDVCGIVVTHGTGAMEEVAYLCDLTFPGTKPVVFTGATYHASDPGSDGPHNLAAAIQVAADPQSQGRGVVICFAGEIHAARDAVKLQKYSPVAFTSPNGPLGLVDAGGLVYYRQATGRIHLPFPPLPVPQVEVVKAVFDMDDLLLRAAIEAQVAGIVVEGLPGSGGVPPALLPSVAKALDRHMPLVLTSRAPFGRITPISRGESGPRVLHEMGAIMAGDLPAHKARLLTAVAVGSGQNVDQLRETFHLVARGGRVPQN